RPQLPGQELHARDAQGGPGDLLPLQRQAAGRRRDLQGRQGGRARPHPVRSDHQVLRPGVVARRPAVGLGHGGAGAQADVRVARRAAHDPRARRLPAAQARQPAVGAAADRRGIRRDRQLRRRQMKRWLVVGGGVAGCVVAARIKQRTGDLVTLVEAGRDHPGEPGDGPLLDDPGRLWDDCLVVRRPGLAPEPYPQGFGLGGSALVNGAVATPDPADPDVEHLLPLTTPDDPGVLGAAVLAASDRATPVRLVGGAGRSRVTPADVYLRPLRGRVEHLYVRTGTRVRRLELDGRRVIGAVSPAGEALEAEHTVLCAGAIHTPALLLRSGIDTPGVGIGLQDHPATAIRLALAPAAAGDKAPSITVAVDGPGHQITVVNHMPGHPSSGAL